MRRGSRRPGAALRAWPRRFLIFLCALAVLIATALFGALDAQSRAVSYIMLDFDSAHDGLTPGGTRFNIYDMKRESVLTAAIAAAGLEDELTWRELSRLLTVAPSRTQSISKRYIATEYRATLQASKKLGNVAPRSMLDIICRVYYEHFLANDGMSYTHLQTDWDELANMEYLEAGQYLETRADILRQFLQSRIDQSGGYESREQAMSFRALLNAVETFQEVFIDKFVALVEQSHVFRSPEAYEQQLTYQRILIEQSYKLSRAQYEIRQKALKNYEESLIAIVMVPTYYQKGGLYMSRTQIGIDTLTAEAESFSQTSQKQAMKLLELDRQLGYLAQASTDGAQADALFANVTQAFDRLTQRVIDADKLYVAYTAGDYMSFSPRTTGLIEAYDLKNACLYAAATAVALSLLCYLIRVYRRAPVVRGGKEARP